MAAAQLTSAPEAVDIVDSDFDETDDEVNEEDAGERELERQQAEAKRVRTGLHASASVSLGRWKES